MSFKPLKFEVQPSKSVGPFALGLPIRDVFKTVTKQRASLPKVEFKYSKKNPLERDLIVLLPENGLSMKFDPVSQKLKFIEIFDFHRLFLVYLGTTFNHKPSRVFPTFLQIYNTFGPTYPGDFDPEQKHYTLSYPGISFIFPIPPQFTNLYEQKTERVQLPIEFPDGTTPVCSRIFVYQGKSLSHISKMPLLSSEKFRSLKYYYEFVTVRPHHGIYFEARKVPLSFGMHCQDVVAEIGMPSAVFFKKDHKMLIHSSVDLLYGASESQDYFYNYFDLGIDILFDGANHKIKRIVMHSNLPGHVNFNNYRKCNFRVLLPTNANGRENGTENGHSDPNQLIDLQSHEPDHALITCDSKWEGIQEILGRPLGDPVIANRGTPPNPFGATRFYGYSGLIFEVTENNHLASIILFAE